MWGPKMTDLKQMLESVVSSDNIRQDEPMKNHTTFRIGGTADYLVNPANSEEAANLVRLLLANQIPFLILGNGSNILVSDKGIRGVVVCIGDGMDFVKVTGNSIVAGAGALLSKVAKEALSCGLSGLEFASGIPGSIGGAMVMNAGAYGSEMKDVVKSVTMLDLETGKVVTFTDDKMEFGYRTSIIKKHPYLVLEAEFELTGGSYDDIKARMDELNCKRREKQPLEYPSAGSAFKRPEGYFAAKLIEDAGMKGYRVGGAMVSDKHSGFIVNVDNASAADVVKVIEDVKAKVSEVNNVCLEPEVIMLGEGF